MSIKLKWTWTSVLAVATVLATAPATAQVVDRPEPNLPAVQDPGPAFPLDQPIEVQLPSGAERALADGAGWGALERVRFDYEGEQPIDVHVHVTVVDPNGREVGSRRLGTTTIRGGENTFITGLTALSKELDPDRGRSRPVAVYSPDKAFPGGEVKADVLPDRRWDERHTVTDSDHMLKKGDRVADKDQDENRIAASKNVKAGEEEVALAGNSTRDRKPGDEAMQRSKPHVNVGEVSGNAGGDNFLVISIVPADEKLRNEVPVRPLVIDLD
ncbi:MAG: hypothetical protein R3326_03465 [Gemmatimonadota bacterium]|nr:hypothetical protein [Gemmatimonadota bacterium]